MHYGFGIYTEIQKASIYGQIWCRGYYVDTVGKNQKKIEEYIRTQLQEDIADDQISMKEFIDPFTGKKVK